MKRKKIQPLNALVARDLPVECKVPATPGEFRQYRPEQVAFVETRLMQDWKGVAIHAPVKCGKLEMMLYASLIRPAGTVFVFLTALKSKDVRSQQTRMRRAGMYIAIAGSIRKDDESLESVLKKIDRDKSICRIVICFDESDYGTGNNQSIHKSGLESVMNNPKVSIWFFSATNEEVIMSSKIHSLRIERFVPSAFYRGSKYFLTHSHPVDNTPLAEEAEQFWNNGKLTNQGIQALSYFTQNKNIGVVRFTLENTYNDVSTGIEAENFNNTLNAMDIIPIFIDAKNSHEWDNDNTWRRYTTNQNQRFLLVLNQTCKRSTAVSVHKHIAFWHDFRKTGTHGTKYNTILQAIGRIFHYDKIGHSIKVFTQLTALKTDAGIISYNEMVLAGMGISSRVNSIGVNVGKPIPFAHTLAGVSFNGKSRLNTQDLKKITAELSAVKQFSPLIANRPKVEYKAAYFSQRKGDDVSKWVLDGTMGANRSNQISLVIFDSNNTKFKSSWKRINDAGLKGKAIAFIAVPPEPVNPDNIVNRTSDSKYGGSVYELRDNLA